MNDKKCVEMLKRNDTSGLLLLIDRYGNYVGKILCSFLGSGLSAQDLEEVTSDVFFKLWQKRACIDPNENVKGYIATIAKNMGRKKLRNTKEVYPLPEDFELMSLDVTPPEMAELSEKEKWANTILLSLNKTDREIFYRHYYLEQTASEIEKTMGIKRSTILSKLSRGRNLIKTKFGGVANEYGFRACEKSNIE